MIPDQLIKFTNKQPPGTGRQAQWDVIKEKCGVKRRSILSVTIIDAFRQTRPQRFLSPCV